MATYEELFDLRRSQKLLDKVTTAVVVAADTIRTEPGTTVNHVNRLIWSREATKLPRQMATIFIVMVLAANKGASPTAIKDAADTAIQANIDDVVNYFADGNPVL